MGKHRAPQAASTDFDAATSALADVTGDYAVDVAHTRIGVRARHAMVTTVRGAFTEFTVAFTRWFRSRCSPVTVTTWRLSWAAARARCCRIARPRRSTGFEMPAR